MSTSYHSFAQVYDKFMDNIPYEDWGHYLYGLFQKYSIKEGTLIELGCGTGTLSLIMAQQGYKIIGIDNSVEMLTIAAAKTAQQSNITLLCQNMQELELGNTYDGFYCLCDSLNYLLSEEDVLETFKRIKHHLKREGVFIFDLKTPYFYETVLGDQIFCDHQPDCSYTWENSYFKEDRINQYELTFFAKKSDSELFERFTEIHHQRAFYISEIIDLLSEAGLEYITAYDAFTDSPPQTDSERIYIIARNGE
ncbi:MAG: class I SAM-dependent methyltransferase [Lachnospiraceae bacterium]|nr:class I SAM-dependent methyltransferase [Lachnospiraceae bacterium]